MNTLSLRFWLFLIGCIGSRTLVTALSYYASRSCALLRMMGALSLIPVIGWFYLIFIGERDTGPEVFGGRIWWGSLRPIHMLLWGFFAYLALSCHPSAWVVLAVDTAFGLGAFLHHHSQTGDLWKMVRGG
jgi:hypothetical protein